MAKALGISLIIIIMIILLSGATKTLSKHPDLGILLTPANRQYHVGDGRPWAVDNGAFSGFDARLFVHLLDRLHGEGKTRGCLFVAAPDVVADWRATVDLFRVWHPLIAAYGYPVGFVLQDGIHAGNVPWAECAAVFIGGSTAWKLSSAAATLAGYAHALGKHVHMGRVNTLKRIQMAWRIGVDSIDGTNYSMYPDTKIPGSLAWIQYLGVQGDFLASRPV